ncbi:MAG: hypothetical protein APF76_03570 [Desulfitibacter sp. BRH_c19]|nr:MAG: hypothetical protein APF76_03570 [Desulfitibacter sp. BRH_c19]
MCKMDKDLLQKYIDKDIAPLEKIVLENHLLSCPECRKDINQLKVMDWDLNNLDIPEVPKELASIRSSALDTYFVALDKEDTSFESKDILNFQYKNLKNTVSFINYLPGKKMVQNAFKKTTTSSNRETKNKSLLSKIIGL